MHLIFLLPIFFINFIILKKNLTCYLSRVKKRVQTEALEGMSFSNLNDPMIKIQNEKAIRGEDIGFS